MAAMEKIKDEDMTPDDRKPKSNRGRRFAPKKNETFKGRQDGLEKAIFECDRPEHAAQFKTTLKELALFVEREYKG